MGQYFKICNLDKKEFLDPSRFGQLNKLPDIGRSGEGVTLALTVLLTLSGTSLYQGGYIYGRWAGDSIAVIGDYYDEEFGGFKWSSDYWCSLEAPHNGWVDISEHVRKVLEEDWNIKFVLENFDEIDDEPRSILHSNGKMTALPPINLLTDKEIDASIPIALASENPAALYWGITAIRLTKKRQFLPFIEKTQTEDQSVFFKRSKKIILKEYAAQVLNELST